MRIGKTPEEKEVVERARQNSDTILTTGGQWSAYELAMARAIKVLFDHIDELEMTLEAKTDY